MELEYAPITNGRVTIGEVNRNVLGLRDDFKEYVETHRLEHRNDWRWLVTAAIACGAFVLSALDKV